MMKKINLLFLQRKERNEGIYCAAEEYQIIYRNE